jgi:hypothetical protein
MDLVRTGDRPEWYLLRVSMPDSTLPVDPLSDWVLAKKSETEIGVPRSA